MTATADPLDATDQQPDTTEPNSRQRNDLGPVGEQVRRNVRRFREDRKISTTKLSQMLGELGRPIQATGITKIESGDRRVDVGDLAALAVALDVTPLQLMLPPDATDDAMVLVPGREVSKVRAVDGDSPSANVAHNLRRIRSARGLTTQELEERLTAIGHRIARSSLTNMELGRRVADLEDVVALGKVFNLPDPWALTRRNDCKRCEGFPPAGFSCLDCGTQAA